MTTFIRAAEVWLPTDDGQLLEHGGGLYPGAAAFGQASRPLCFGRAEGLPGQAWDEARPVLLTQFEGSTFRRTALALAAGLHSAVALPIFIDDRLTSVVVLLCGPAGSGQGAIELWHNDPRITGDLRLAAGLFGADGQALQNLGEDAFLPRGSGLPGLAWQRQAAVFAAQLDEHPQFLRAQTAAAAGIVRGLAVPCATPGAHTWVLNLLSSRSTPIAHRVESWLPGAAGGGYQRSFGHCEVSGALAAGQWIGAHADAGPGAVAAFAAVATDAPVAPVAPVAGFGPIGLAFATGRAVVADDLRSAPDLLTADAAAVGLTSMLALPVADGAAVGEVLALYF